jgi:hypothetical protein
MPASAALSCVVAVGNIFYRARLREVLEGPGGSGTGVIVRSVPED